MALSSLDQGYDLREATAADAKDILTITNDAFVADAFFKKMQYHERFDPATVDEMLAAENSVFLLAVSKNPTDAEAGGVVGSIFLHWDIQEEGAMKSVTGKFSAVSVPTAFEKRGIGRALVAAAETKIRSIASSLASDGALVTSQLQMGVINLREDLFPWYKKQGFSVCGEIRGDPEIERITLEEMKDKIWLVLMSKDL